MPLVPLLVVIGIGVVLAVVYGLLLSPPAKLVEKMEGKKTEAKKMEGKKRGPGQ